MTWWEWVIAYVVSGAFFIYQAWVLYRNLRVKRWEGRDVL